MVPAAREQHSSRAAIVPPAGARRRSSAQNYVSDGLGPGRRRASAVAPAAHRCEGCQGGNRSSLLRIGHRHVDGRRPRPARAATPHGDRQDGGSRGRRGAADGGPRRRRGEAVRRAKGRGVVLRRRRLAGARAATKLRGHGGLRRVGRAAARGARREQRIPFAPEPATRSTRRRWRRSGPCLRPRDRQSSRKCSSAATRCTTASSAPRRS